MIERLRAHPMFRDVPDEDLAALAARMEATELANGETLFREGDPGDVLYVVEQGEIAVRKDDQTLAVLRPGDLLGEMALFEQESRSADAVAVGDTRVRGIGTEAFRAFIREHPTCGTTFLFEAAQDLSGRLRRTSDYLATVFETGKIVGSGLGLGEMTTAILRRVLDDAHGADGGTILVFNPFTESLETAARIGSTRLDEEAAGRLVGRHAREETFQDRRDAAVLGVALRDEKEAVLGYVLLEKSDPGASFTRQQEVVLAAVGRQTGLGILNAYHRQEEEGRERLAQKRLQDY